jgi:hypothetical protein
MTASWQDVHVSPRPGKGRAADVAILAEARGDVLLRLLKSPDLIGGDQMDVVSAFI